MKIAFSFSIFFWTFCFVDMLVLIQTRKKKLMVDAGAKEIYQFPSPFIEKKKIFRLNIREPVEKNWNIN